MCEKETKVTLCPPGFAYGYVVGEVEKLDPELDQFDIGAIPDPSQTDTPKNIDTFEPEAEI